MKLLNTILYSIGMILSVFGGLFFIPNLVIMSINTNGRTTFQLITVATYGILFIAGIILVIIYKRRIRY